MGLLADVNPASLAAVVLLAIISGLLLWRSRCYLARQKRDAVPLGAAGHEPPPNRLSPEPPDDLTRWEVSLHETGRDLAGKLDSKMSVLGHLVQEADRAAARLEAAIAAAQGAGPLSPPSGDTSYLAPCEHTGGSSHQDTGGLFHEHTEGPPHTSPPQAASQAEGLKSAAAAGQTRTDDRRYAEPKPAAEADDRYEEVYLLADYGLEAAEIASRLRRPVGEVELILSLRSRR